MSRDEIRQEMRQAMQEHGFDDPLDLVLVRLREIRDDVERARSLVRDVSEFDAVIEKVTTLKGLPQAEREASPLWDEAIRLIDERAYRRRRFAVEARMARDRPVQ